MEYHVSDASQWLDMAESKQMERHVSDVNIGLCRIVGLTEDWLSLGEGGVLTWEFSRGQRSGEDEFGQRIIILGDK